MESRVVGRGGLALMLPVVEKGRALPLAWRVRHRPTGHGPEALHIAMGERMSPVRPEGVTVVLRGEGACDGTALQAPRNEVGWSSVCRTALRTTATWEGEPLRREAFGTCLQPGQLMALPEVYSTRAASGPIRVLCCGAKGEQAPRELVSHLAPAEETGRLYPKRFHIEM